MRDKKRNWKKAAAAGMSLFLVFGASGCAGAGDIAPGEGESQPIPVTVEKVQRGTLSSSASFTGKITPDQTVSVYPKASGTVKAVYFSVGDEVKKGDLIFEIDPVDIQLQVDSAKAALDAAVAGANAAAGGQDLAVIQNDMSVWSAKQPYDKAKDALEAFEDANPSKSTLKANVTTAQQAYDAAKAAYGAIEEEGPEKEAAKADMEAAAGALTAARTALATYNSTIDQLENAADLAKDSLNFARDSKEVSEGEIQDHKDAAQDAQLRQVEIAYESALRQLEYTKVYAPVDGTLEAVNVSENNMATSQGPACVISSSGTMTAEMSLPAGVVMNLSPRDSLTVECAGASYSAEITEIGTAANQVGLYPVKAAISGGGELLSGMTAKITLDTDRAENAMILPIACLYYDNNKPYVYVMKEGAAVKTYLETGISDSENVVILSGIGEGDQVISSWNPGLMDGAAVTEAEIGE